MNPETYLGKEIAVPVILRERARANPDGLLVQDVDGNALTNAEFHDRAIGIADALAELGVGPGDCVVTFLDTSLDAFVCWLGVSWRRGWEVPVNPEFRASLLTYAINDSKAEILITSAKYLPVIEGVWSELKYVRLILTVDEPGEPGRLPVRELEELVRSAPKAEHDDPRIDDPHGVIYTSGTTGQSKGVLQSWGVLQQVQHNFSGEIIDPADTPCYYSPWPNFHASGRVGMAFSAVRGGHFVVRGKFSASAFLDDARRFGCTHVQMMGIAGYLMNQPERADDAFNPLRWALMNPVIADYRAFERRFGVRVSTGWGMTEIGFPVNASDLPNARTCGRLSPLYDARIVGGDGEDLPDGEAGQLLIRGKKPWLLLKEYLGKPEANEKAWDDGWFKTGDVLRRDPDGYYYFVDRAKDYMRVRGNNVSSMELEAEVRSHHDVAECAAIGIRDDRSGIGGQRAAGEDEIRVFVALNAGSAFEPDALLTYLRGRLPGYMLPRFIDVVDDFERTPTGKIRKEMLRDVAFGPETFDSLALG